MAPESVLPSHSRVDGNFEPSPVKVLWLPLSLAMATCQDFTALAFENRRARSMLVRPFSAVGENPLASVWMRLWPEAMDGAGAAGVAAGAAGVAEGAVGAA